MTARSLRNGIMVLAALVLLTAPGAAAPGVWNEAAVPVARADGVYCSLDATTVKRTTTLSGATFVDVWVKYRLDAGAGHRLGVIAGGRAAGLAADEAREVRVRYLFWLTDGRFGQGSLKVELEKQIVSAAGVVLYQKEISAPGYMTKWSSLDALEEKVLLRLVTQRAFHADCAFDSVLARSAPLIEAGEGFTGFPWGTRPGAFAGAMHVTDIGDALAVYHAVMDVWPILGNTRADAGVWLIFSRRDGLVMARIDIDGSSADAVEKHLFRVAGQPLMVEKRAGASAPGELQLDWLWHTGRTTEVALLEGIGGATVVANRRGFILPETAAAFESRLASALALKADTHRKKGEPLTASVYQQLLLNTARGYNGFINDSQRQLEWAPATADGFAGIHWGTAPDVVHDILPVGGANLGMATVLFTDAGSRGWGEDVKLLGPGLMVFDRHQGLVGVSYRFEARYYRQLYDALQAVLGSPYTQRAATVTWHVGANTVYVLDLSEGGKTGVVTVADREFWYSRSILFEYL